MYFFMLFTIIAQIYWFLPNNTTDEGFLMQKSVFIQAFGQTIQENV